MHTKRSQCIQRGRNAYKEVAMHTKRSQCPRGRNSPNKNQNERKFKKKKIFPVQKVPWHRFFPRKSVTLFGNKTPFSTLWLSVHFLEFWTRSTPKKCTATANPVHRGNPSGARRRRDKARSSTWLEIVRDTYRELDRVTHSSLYLDTLEQHIVRYI